MPSSDRVAPFTASAVKRRRRENHEAFILMGVLGGGRGVVGVLCWVLFCDRAEMRSSQGLIGNWGGELGIGGGFWLGLCFFFHPHNSVT